MARDHARVGEGGQLERLRTATPCSDSVVVRCRGGAADNSRGIRRGSLATFAHAGTVAQRLPCVCPERPPRGRVGRGRGRRPASRRATVTRQPAHRSMSASCADRPVAGRSGAAAHGRPSLEAGLEPGRRRRTGRVLRHVSRRRASPWCMRRRSTGRAVDTVVNTDVDTVVALGRRRTPGLGRRRRSGCGPTPRRALVAPGAAGPPGPCRARATPSTRPPYAGSRPPGRTCSGAGQA